METPADWVSLLATHVPIEVLGVFSRWRPLWDTHFFRSLPNGRRLELGPTILCVIGNRIEQCSMPLG
jgi:hypothetical protein